jgi:hypothetical protein
MAIASVMSVSLVITTTKKSLYTLLAAINPNAPRTISRVDIRQNTSGSAAVYIGDSNLADARYAHELIDENTPAYIDETQGCNGISTTNIFLKVIAAGADQTVHCRVRVF